MNCKCPDNGIGFQKIIVRIEGVDISVIQDKDPVCGLHAGYTLSNNDLGGSRYLFGKSRPDACVSLPYPPPLVESSGSEPSVFSAELWQYTVSVSDRRKHWRAALDLCLITGGHPVDKFIGAGCLTGFFAFFFRRVRISPAQIVKNRSGKQSIFLKDYRDLISQNLRIVFADVHAAYADGTGVPHHKDGRSD